MCLLHPLTTGEYSSKEASSDLNCPPLPRKMPSSRVNRLLLAFCAIAVACCLAEHASEKRRVLSLEELDEQLQVRVKPKFQVHPLRLVV